MIINIGSQNNVKINAVAELIKEYNFLSDAKVISQDADSGVPAQPKTINETILGAKNRAKNCFQNCDYSFGIESGLMEVSEVKTGYMNICVCAIYNGKEFCIGVSSAFEYPNEVINLVLKEGLEINDAVHRLKYTDNPKIGSAGGFIEMLTRGRLNRKDYTKQAIMMALIDLDRKNSPSGANPKPLKSNIKDVP